MFNYVRDFNSSTVLLVVGRSHHILLGVEGVMISCSRKWYTSRGSWFITLDTQHRGPSVILRKLYILYFSVNVPGKCGTKASLRLLALASLRLEVEQSLGTQDDHSDHGPTRHSWVQGTKQLENYMHDGYLKRLVSKTMYNSRNYVDVVRTTKRRHSCIRKMLPFRINDGKKARGGRRYFL